MRDFIDLQGASGASYRFRRRPEGAAHLPTAGNYAEALKIYRWYMPLLHLDTHVKLVQYIKLAAAECGFGNEVTRAPRLPLVGREREDVLGIIRKAIATRPMV